ncbi:MAG: hypothetical protein V4450_00245 [Bacteroidota bacterium]
MRIRISSSFALFCACFLISCSSVRPSAHIIINNDSNKDVPLQVSITDAGSHTVSRTISQTLRPGIQEIAAGKFAKGLYNVAVETDKGIVSISKPVSLDADRWIIINYTSTDSMSIAKKYGYVDTNFLKKINGKYTGIDLFSENRRPPSL